jgi:xanthine/CO dehydrogenase XdhC/CoxF family maturation factor
MAASVVAAPTDLGGIAPGTVGPYIDGNLSDRGDRPMLSTDTDILREAENWRRAGKGVALATVVETWGSAPRPVGSHLVIDEEGNFLGSVSGGCVEGAVITDAMDVIEDGTPRMLEFGVADETAWRVGLSCGGRIRVYVERVD